MKIFKFQNVYFLIVQTKKCSYFENVRIKKMFRFENNLKNEKTKGKLKRKIKNEKKNGKKKTENKNKIGNTKKKKEKKRNEAERSSDGIIGPGP